MLTRLFYSSFDYLLWQRCYAHHRGSASMVAVLASKDASSRKHCVMDWISMM